MAAWIDAFCILLRVVWLLRLDVAQSHSCIHALHPQTTEALQPMLDSTDLRLGDLEESIRGVKMRLHEVATKADQVPSPNLVQSIVQKEFRNLFQKGSKRRLTMGAFSKHGKRKFDALFITFQPRRAVQERHLLLLCTIERIITLNSWTHPCSY